VEGPRSWVLFLNHVGGPSPLPPFEKTNFSFIFSNYTLFSSSLFPLKESCKTTLSYVRKFFPS